MSLSIPKPDPAQGRVIAVSSLCRWNSCILGSILPVSVQYSFWEMMMNSLRNLVDYLSQISDMFHCHKMHCIPIIPWRKTWIWFCFSVPVQRTQLWYWISTQLILKIDVNFPLPFDNPDLAAYFLDIMKYYTFVFLVFG